MYEIVFEKRKVREGFGYSLKEEEIMDNITGVISSSGDMLITPKVIYIAKTPTRVITGIPVIPLSYKEKLEEDYALLDRDTTLSFFTLPDNVEVYRDDKVSYIKESIAIRDGEVIIL